MPPDQQDVAIDALPILQLPARPQRVETGLVQFGDDVPGLYIRGDRLEYMAHELKHALATFDTKGPGENGLLEQHVEALRYMFSKYVVVHTLPREV